MLTSDIQWKPIRLEIQRKSNHRFSIFRDGDHCGSVYLTKDGWRTVFHYDKQHSTGGLATSFRTAVLRLTRRHVSDNCRIQDFGLMHVRRICVNGLWFTAIIHPETETSHLFLDYNDQLVNPNDHMQSILKRAVLCLKLDK